MMAGKSVLKGNRVALFTLGGAAQPIKMYFKYILIAILSTDLTPNPIVSNTRRD